MGIYSLYIINKAGGLTYRKNFLDVPKLGDNSYLRLASTFHGLHTITAQISPVGNSSGIETLEADTFKVCCLATVTGIKFFIIADPATSNTDSFLRTVYELYSDYVLKNPFYEVEMPIYQCSELFSQNLDRSVAEYNRG